MLTPNRLSLVTYSLSNLAYFLQLFFVYDFDFTSVDGD